MLRDPSARAGGEALARSARLALLAKYTELRRLRSGDDGGEPVERMRALASRYPGALREIDELPIEAIHSRIEALEARGRRPPPWAAPMARFHSLLRACLLVKRNAGRDPRAAEGWVREHYRPAGDEPPKEQLCALASTIARPPGGRLSQVVMALVADEWGLTPSACERLMFPPSPRRGASR